jgi:ribosomal protein S18 acetylase RimI-like enzyme
MAGELIFREATAADIPFLVETIIEAEKSGTDVLSYTTVFGLGEAEAKKYITAMLEEEVDGCELSVSSFLLAEKDGQVAAAIAAWIEGEEGIPSTVLKGNLLNYTLPKSNIEKAMEVNPVLRDLHIEYKTDTLQLGLVYVSAGFRGQDLVRLLIEEKVRRAKEKRPSLSEMYVQVFGDNKPAIRAYEKAGFSTILTRDSADKRVADYLPSPSKVLMRKELK